MPITLTRAEWRWSSRSALVTGDTITIKPETKGKFMENKSARENMSYKDEMYQKIQCGGAELSRAKSLAATEVKLLSI